MISEIRQRFDAAPMGRTQIIAVAMTFILSALDGYDVLSVTFAAPAITAQWNVGKAALGLVLSAGLVGMALGSFVLAPLADVYGRKTMVLVSLGLMALGMLLSAGAGSLEQLALWRVLTGLGIGACVAVINPLAAEFANARRRPLAVALMAVGYPVGGMIGGLLAAILLQSFGWQAIFLAGFAGSLVLLPAVLWLLPESPAFLVSSRRPDRLERLNAVLMRCGQPTVPEWSEVGSPARRGYAAVFAPGQRGSTAWLTSANLLYVMAVYFTLSWMPQMVADAGFAPSAGSVVSAVASSTGIAGCLIMGWLAQGGGLRWLVAGAMIGLGIALSAFGQATNSLALLTVLGGVCGFLLFGGAAGLYATLATTFGDEARATGSGFVIGVGRVSSAVAPVLAGWLFASGLGRAEVSAAFGACAALGGLIIVFGWTRFRKP